MNVGASAGIIPGVLRWGFPAIAVVRATIGIAHAGPVEASGFVEASCFVGIVSFGETGLGDSWAAEQAPRTAPVIGGRVAWLPRVAAQVQLGLEGEVALASAFTGDTDVAGRGDRLAYFAPVFGWRGHALLRLDLGAVRPHLVVGGGGGTVASSSPYMAKETDPVAYWGPGVTLAVADRWHLRIDLRHGIMPARETRTTSTIELQLGISTSFGTRRPLPPPPVVPVLPVVPVVPVAPVTLPDPDRDGVVGAGDQCPDEPEDLDRFADDDGCPDPDNDGDGIADATDACPLEPETRNGIADRDGCADAIPPALVQALAKLPNHELRRGRARLTPALVASLEVVLAELHAQPELRIVVLGRPDRATPEALARRRAEAVKWYLVDRGIAVDRIATGVAAGAGAVAIELIAP